MNHNSTIGPPQCGCGDVYECEDGYICKDDEECVECIENEDCQYEDVCLDNECITYDYVEGVNNGKR